MNEKLLEAHKKVVQSKLNREVARTIFDAPSDMERGGDGDNPGDVSSPRMNNGPGNAKFGGSRRFAPHLEGIPEESRANTLNAKSNDSHSERKTNDSSPSEVSRETNEPRKGGTAPSKKLSTSDPQSLDSGILTRSSSISDLSDSQTDVVTSNSCDFDTDNETVDVADSDETSDDTDDSDTYAEEERYNRSNGSNQSNRTSLHSLPVKQEFRKFDHGRQKKDFVSELYNTAVSKVPKVIPSDSESLYSSNSTMRKDFEYDSLDINSNCRLKDIYTNPNLTARSRIQQQNVDKGDYEVVGVRERRDNVAEVYVNNEYDTGTLESGADGSEPGYEFSAGERMMISISGDNESVYSNKLLISVNSNQAPAKFFSPEPSFDPDTLERATKNARTEFYGSADSLEVHGSKKDNTPETLTKSKSSFFLFREVTGADQSNLASSSLPPYSNPALRKPSLPPKTRLTPKLPPKPSPGQNSRLGQRPLPPPPPPPPK